MTHKKPLVLITGASSGIGVELARVFAREGFDLVVAARRKPELDALSDELAAAYHSHCYVLPCDLTAPGEIEKLVAGLPKRPLDVLVNNAGLMQMKEFAEDDMQRQLQQIQLNVTALTELTYRCLKPMLKRGEGRIANLASVAAFQPVPMLAVYAATKAYVLSFSEALSEELKGTGVSCTAICPGFTDTPMLRGHKNPTRKPPTLPLGLIADPAFVANEAYKAIMGRDVIMVPGMAYKALTTLSRLPPKGLVRSLVGGVGRLVVKKK
ncbi:MAG: SDR family oxidoreductase [Gammaproteobacteria bacterium]|nr:SDR family oxidoreductase [Gammaproteobacteria bacterium]